MSKASESKAGKKDEKKKKADKTKRVTGQNAGPRGFLVEHGEKAAFGAFGLVVILCALGALRHEPYTKTPEQLAATLQQKRQAVKQNTPESFEPLKSVQVVPYGERVGESVAAVPDEYRGPSIGVPIPDLKIMRKRGQPEYLPVENLKAYPINEALAMLAPGAKKAVAKAEPAKQAKAAPKKKDNLLGPPGGGSPLGKGKKAMPKAMGGSGAKMPETMAGPPASKWVPTRGGVDAPNAEAKAFPGVLIVGTIPRKKQTDLYQREFAVARDYDATLDAPHYVSFLMQRSKDGGQTWEDTVTVQTAKGPKETSLLGAYWEISQRFATVFPEIVDTSSGQYIVPFSMVEKREGEEVTAKPDGFTVSPLPPILGRDWDEIVAGGFPLISKSESQPGIGGHDGAPRAGGMGGPPGAGPQSAQPGQSPGGMPQPGLPNGAIRKQVRGPGSTPQAVGKPGGAGTGAAPAMPGAAKAGPGAGPGGGGMGTPPGAGPGGGMGTKPGLNPFAPKSNQPTGQGMAGGGRTQDTSCDFLFRFFDFTAEEGQTYQYRVQLVLNNPNFGRTEGVLKDARLRKDEYHLSPLSQPTAPVRVSVAGSDVVAGPVRGARVETATADSATVILRQRHRQNGALVAHTFNRLEAGQVFNLKAQSVKYEKAVGGVETSPLAEFDFQSDELLLDLKGGGDRGWPGEILLLDANGRLSVKGELSRADASTKRAGGQPTREPRSPSAASGVHFASESKRLEYIYNHGTAPTTSGPSGGQPSFEDLLKPTK